jgi:hypothetical protein
VPLQSPSISLFSVEPSVSESSTIADPLGTSEDEETIRVRIWRALAAGEELTLQQLGKAVGHHRDLRSHLKHVARQAESLTNKSDNWRRRRGLPTDGIEKRNSDKRRLMIRKGNRRNETFVRLE